MGYVKSMTLNDYLLKEGLSTAKFAKRNGFPFETVRKWRQRSRIPRARALFAIEKITNGEVKINDWYSAEVWSGLDTRDYPEIKVPMGRETVSHSSC